MHLVLAWCNALLYYVGIETAKKEETKMTYQEFKTEMQSLLNESFKYTIHQAGSGIFTEKMADLADAYPDYDEMLDNEAL